jgi:hypothetical protein
VIPEAQGLRAELEFVRMPVSSARVLIYLTNHSRIERFRRSLSATRLLSTNILLDAKHLELYLAFSERLWISLIHY